MQSLAAVGILHGRLYGCARHTRDLASHTNRILVIPTPNQLMGWLNRQVSISVRKKIESIKVASMSAQDIQGRHSSRSEAPKLTRRKITNSPELSHAVNSVPRDKRVDYARERNSSQKYIVRSLFESPALSRRGSFMSSTNGGAVAAVPAVNKFVPYGASPMGSEQKLAELRIKSSRGSIRIHQELERTPEPRHESIGLKALAKTCVSLHKEMLRSAEQPYIKRSEPNFPPRVIGPVDPQTDRKLCDELGFYWVDINRARNKRRIKYQGGLGLYNPVPSARKSSQGPPVPFEMKLMNIDTETPAAKPEGELSPKPLAEIFKQKLKHGRSGSQVQGTNQSSLSPLSTNANFKQMGASIADVKMGKSFCSIKEASSREGSMMIVDEQRRLLQKWKKIDSELRAVHPEYHRVPVRKTRLMQAVVTKINAASNWATLVPGKEGSTKQLREKLPEHLKTFSEFCINKFKRFHPQQRSVLYTELVTFFEAEMTKFFESLMILKDYLIERKFLEDTLSEFVSKKVHNINLRPIFFEAIIKDNSLQASLVKTSKQRAIRVAQMYRSIPEKPEQYDLLTYFLVLQDLGEEIVFSMKTRHFNKLKDSVVSEFQKYKANYKALFINKSKFTYFKDEIGEQHEMIKAAKKFATLKGNFDILTKIEQLEEDGQSVGQYETKRYLLNKHLKNIVGEFALLS